MDVAKERDPIPEFESIEQIADFWDTHSTADYDDLTHEVQFAVSPPEKEPVHLIPALSHRLAQLARRQGVSVETLVNVWLTEKLFEAQG